MASRTAAAAHPGAKSSTETTVVKGASFDDPAASSEADLSDAAREETNRLSGVTNSDGEGASNSVIEEGVDVRGDLIEIRDTLREAAREAADLLREIQN